MTTTTAAGQNVVTPDEVQRAGVQVRAAHTALGEALDLFVGLVARLAEQNIPATEDDGPSEPEHEVHPVERVLADLIKVLGPNATADDVSRARAILTDLAPMVRDLLAATSEEQQTAGPAQPEFAQFTTGDEEADRLIAERLELEQQTTSLAERIRAIQDLIDARLREVLQSQSGKGIQADKPLVATAPDTEDNLAVEPHHHCDRVQIVINNHGRLEINNY